MAVKGTVDETEPTGAKVTPVYSERQMKCLVITEAELKTLSLANTAMMVFIGIGSALLGFAVDVSKDLTLDTMTADAAATATFARTGAFIGAVLMFFIAFLAWNWRRESIELIRRESKKN